MIYFLLIPLYIYLNRKVFNVPQDVYRSTRLLCTVTSNHQKTFKRGKTFAVIILHSIRSGQSPLFNTWIELTICVRKHIFRFDFYLPITMRHEILDVGDKK